jgi:GTP:adenosylcobinamide-phosphate guanylyltransferase
MVKKTIKEVIIEKSIKRTNPTVINPNKPVFPKIKKINKNKLAKTAGENFLKDTIRGLGLALDIQHTLFPKAQKVRTQELTITKAIGKTEVKLYVEADMKIYKELKTPFDERRAIAYGVTYCSATDNFDRQYGRIGALQRALKMYNPDIVKEVRKERKRMQKILKKNKRL